MKRVSVATSKHRRSSPRAVRAPNKSGLAQAVTSFLKAAGVDLSDPNLTDTPSRVATAWADEFLNGYQQNIIQILGERFPVEPSASPNLVLVSSLHFHSMCPHHLMPYSGTAHIAYLAKSTVVGFGRLSSLLDAYAHRLVLQETLATQVAQALMDVLQCQGAACLIQAQQTCFTLRGPNQHQSTTYSECFLGELNQPQWRSAVASKLASEISTPSKAGTVS